MKTIETKLYSYAELSPKAQARVIEREAERIQTQGYSEDFTLRESVASLKAVSKALGLRLTDWNIGPYNRNNHCSVNSDEAGNKAIAQFVRVLIAHGYKRKPTFKAMLTQGTGSFVGVCGFTGVCFDEDVCEAILEALLDGETMSKAFDRAADRIHDICEKDLEWRTSKEGILEYLDKKAELYTDDGTEF